MDTRPLTVDLADAWCIFECLQAQLAGFGGRQETSEPWHALNLMEKLRPAIADLEGNHSSGAYQLYLNRGELVCISFNVPRTASEGAKELLLRVFQALEELSLGIPHGPHDSETPETRRHLAEWRERMERERPSELKES